MKNNRRYREKCNANTIGISSTYANQRIHDFLKGWGTISKDGKSVLWDSYRPPTKKQREKLEAKGKKEGLTVRQVISLAIEEFISKK